MVAQCEPARALRAQAEVRQTVLGLSAALLQSCSCSASRARARALPRLPISACQLLFFT